MKHILIISPHIDDAEYAMGGTLIKYRDAGDEITMAITAANDDLAGDIESRKKEQEASSEFLNVKKTWFFNKEMDIETKVRILDACYPDVIYYPYENDPHHHHHEGTKIGFAVARNFQITAIQYISQRSFFYFPNLYERIDIEAKKNLVSVFKSQNGRRPKFMEIMETQDRYFGSMFPGNGNYAEGFVLHRMIRGL